MLTSILATIGAALVAVGGIVFANWDPTGVIAVLTAIFSGVVLILQTISANRIKEIQARQKTNADQLREVKEEVRLNTVETMKGNTAVFESSAKVEELKEKVDAKL